MRIAVHTKAFDPNDGSKKLKGGAPQQKKKKKKKRKKKKQKNGEPFPL